MVENTQIEVANTTTEEIVESKNIGNMLEEALLKDVRMDIEKLSDEKSCRGLINKLEAIQSDAYEGFEQVDSNLFGQLKLQELALTFGEMYLDKAIENMQDLDDYVSIMLASSCAHLPSKTYVKCISKAITSLSPDDIQSISDESIDYGFSPEHDDLKQVIDNLLHTIAELRRDAENAK